MAVPDPTPSIARPTHQRFVRTLRVAAVLSIIVAALSVAMVARGQSEARIHILIATALGIALTVLLGTALATLILLGNSRGRKADAGAPASERDKT